MAEKKSGCGCGCTDHTPKKSDAKPAEKKTDKKSK